MSKEDNDNVDSIAKRIYILHYHLTIYYPNEFYSFFDGIAQIQIKALKILPPKTKSMFSFGTHGYEMY